MDTCMSEKPRSPVTPAAEQTPAETIVHESAPITEGCTVNRELSWLAFNRRVLQEGACATRPPLDRLSFFGIFLNNLDEFYRVRVGTLMDALQSEEPLMDDKTGWTPSQQLAEIEKTVSTLMIEAQRIEHEIRLAFEREKIYVLSPESLEGARAVTMTKYFKEELKPQLSPMVIDSHHPFPFLRDRECAILSRFGHHSLGVIPLGRLPAFHLFDEGSQQWVLQTADVVRFFANKLYGKQEPSESIVCRVTRNADLAIEEHEGDVDFLGTMREFVRRRKKLMPVRIQYAPGPSNALKDLLKERFNFAKEIAQHVQSLPLGPELAFGIGKALPEAVAQRLSAPPHKPCSCAWAKEGPIADLVRAQDRLLHFPFESINPFVRLLEQAAEDPKVTAIRITLYRLAKNSRIAQALARAAENGKDVLCVLELRARFDEESNINYADMLQEAGCTVIYGLPEYKVHAKVCLILYNDATTITQIGTGNYNEKTAALYTDLSYLTANPEIGKDAIHLFRQLCLGDPACRPSHLWIAPKTFLSNVLRELDNEIAEAKAGRAAYAFLKVNGLNSMPLIAKLIEASQAGVKVEMNIRGICCLRPGIPGKTENIRIFSIVGTYLEHSRILCFGAHGRERIWIGSGDFLNRNLNRRVEVYTPILSEACKRDLLHLIDLLRTDTVKARQMQPDGSYITSYTNDLSADSQQKLRHYYLLQNKDPEYAPQGFWARLRAKLSHR